MHDLCWFGLILRRIAHQFVQIADQMVKSDMRAWVRTKSPKLPVL